MKRIALSLFVFCLLVWSAVEAVAVPEWNQLYTGDALSGKNVIACWQFLPGRETEDGSGNGHVLTLRGEQAKFVSGGKFGNCLQSFPGGPKHDKPSGAAAKSTAALNPRGAFTVEVWFNLDETLGARRAVYLLDKKYIYYSREGIRANSAYGLRLDLVAGDTYRFMVGLGFGETSAYMRSENFTLTPGEWYHGAFTYDGEGVVCFFLNGEKCGRGVSKGKTSVAPNNHPLVIGDRVGSTHDGFPGRIDQVRILRGIPGCFAGTADLTLGASRTVFYRLEKKAEVKMQVVNSAAEIAKKLVVSYTFMEKTRILPVPDLRKGEEYELVIPVETDYRAGSYPLVAELSGECGGRPVKSLMTLPVQLVPRALPNQMPVVLWGSGDIERLKEIGFTHDLKHVEDYAKIWQEGAGGLAASSDRIASSARMLNSYLANGLGAVVYLYPGRWVSKNSKLAKYLRVDRDGKVSSSGHANTSASFPEVQQFGYNVGAAVARTFHDFPALNSALVHSEIRDGTSISFHPHEQEACRQALGFDIPANAESKRGVRYDQIPGFPADHVIPDDYPLLRFYKWFWSDGDGWNSLHSQVSKGLHSTGRDDLWTFFDPAVRAPSVWGSGGNVDVVSQWTYSYPDPLKIGQAADELFALADGTARQQVMKMTQAIWYRSGTAPMESEVSGQAQWERDKPEAKFISIAPDHLREAFWCKLARPIRGIMYHGWGSLVESKHGSYRLTNLRSAEVLKGLIRDVVRPLGPTLLQVPDRRADVAILESFSSQIFAGRGSYGWSGSWEADMHLICQWAGLQPKVIFDQHVMRDGLGDYKILVMPHCDVLSESIVRKISDFQDRGGLVVADETLCPAILPDILIYTCLRKKKDAAASKALLLEKAAKLTQQLESFYVPYVGTSEQEIVPRVRSYGSSDYVFAVNDRRTYGDYVGHHKMVMEKGLPHNATLSIRREGVVYDLLRSRRVDNVGYDNGELRFPVDFGPTEGRLFLVTDKKISKVVVSGPKDARRSGTVPLRIEVRAGGQAVDAVVPVRVDILDSEGKEAEWSGWYGARDGILKLSLDIAPNDAVGKWSIKVRELASGLSAEHVVEVR